MNILNVLKFALFKPKIPSVIYNCKARYTFEERSNDAHYVYFTLNKIPVVLEKDETSNLPEIDISNYMLPSSITISEFMVYLRKKSFKLGSEGMYLFMSNSNYVPSLDEKLFDLYDKFKDNDGFLYCKYTNSK